MSNADALRNLAQDMAQAHEERTRRIAEIGKETAGLLNGFDREHQAMSQELRAKLASDESQRKSEDQGEISQRKSDISSMLDSFDKEHQAMSQELRAELAKVKPEIARGEAERKSEDQGEISQMKSEVSSLLDDFDKQHHAMSQELRAELAKVKADLASAEAERKSQTQAEISQRKSDVSSLLDRFDAEAKERAEEVISIRSEARHLVESFRKESAETAAAWRDLVATMQAKRGVAVAPRPAKPPVAAPVEEEIPTEEVAPEERGDLESIILGLIAEHPEGVKLIEIAEATGEARVKLGNITRMLVEEGQIRKEGLLYFLA